MSLANCTPSAPAPMTTILDALRMRDCASWSHEMPSFFDPRQGTAAALSEGDGDEEGDADACCCASPFKFIC